ncbi:MAG TPA: SGNH/GDSL hydrolase family protein [Chthoniobacterales bacterium]|nr:SGNH/GDSL hydrolase family protein [Chthoniobacterales bacterium]
MRILRPLHPSQVAELLAISRCAVVVLMSLFLPISHAFGQNPPTFSQVIVFGDSYSDDGNVRRRTETASGGQVSYPSGVYNFADGRFTNSANTTPGSAMYAGLWHEQLAQSFLGLPAATFSLGGGTDFAFGAATTQNGTSERTVIPSPGGDLTITIDNMGKQVDDYLASHAVNGNALYLVWGGINDLLNDESPASVSATANRVGSLISRLALAGANHILVPNVPPLGMFPNYAGDEARITSLNEAAGAYRFQLDAALDSTVNTLAAQGVHPTIYRLDIWSRFVRIAAQPSDYGFTDIGHVAQGDSSANPDQFLFWDVLHPTTAGHFQIAKEANRALSGSAGASARALNLSSRVTVGTGENVSIAGFIITGSIAKRVLLRGIGPSLTGSGVPDVLANPTLELFDSANSSLATNDNWRTTQESEIAATGLAPTNDLESAIIRTLAPGSYTAVLAGQNGGNGNGLVEVYDLDTAPGATLANISTRGFVGVGNNVLIGGLIIGSGQGPIVAMRAIGPSLLNAGITHPLLDPTIELHNGNGDEIEFNDDWKDTQTAAIRAIGLTPADDREATIVASLEPGNYTVIVRGRNNTTGVALVEAYRIP